MNRLAKPERLGAGVIMVTEFSGHTLNAYIMDVVVLQDITGNICTGQSGACRVLTVFSEPSLGDT